MAAAASSTVPAAPLNSPSRTSASARERVSPEDDGIRVTADDARPQAEAQAQAQAQAQSKDKPIRLVSVTPKNEFDLAYAQEMARAAREAEFEKRLSTMKHQVLDKIKRAIERHCSECIYEVPMVIENDHPFYIRTTSRVNDSLLAFLQKEMEFSVQCVHSFDTHRFTIAWDRREDLKNCSLRELEEKRDAVEQQRPQPVFSIYHAFLYEVRVRNTVINGAAQRLLAQCYDRIRECIEVKKLPSLQHELTFDKALQGLDTEKERLSIYDTVVAALQANGFCVNEQVPSLYRFRVSGWVDQPGAGAGAGHGLGQGQGYGPRPAPHVLRRQDSTGARGDADGAAPTPAPPSSVEIQLLLDRYAHATIKHTQMRLHKMELDKNLVHPSYKEKSLQVDMEIEAFANTVSAIRQQLLAIHGGSR